jgi:hypothetical protein
MKLSVSKKMTTSKPPVMADLLLQSLKNAAGELDEEFEKIRRELPQMLASMDQFLAEKQEKDPKYWKNQFKSIDNTLLLQNIDTFIAHHGINMMFYYRSDLYEFNDAFNDRPVRCGTLLTIATEFAQSLDIIRYLVEQHHADVNIPNAANQIPLMVAAERSNYDFAQYLLENGSNIQQYSVLRSLSTVPQSEHEQQKRIVLIKNLLMIGDKISSSGFPLFISDRGRFNAELESIKNILYLEHLEREFCETVMSLILNRVMQSAPDIFVIQDPINLSQETELAKEIDEDYLTILIHQLEDKGTPLAYFVCGLLLEGRIANDVPERYKDDSEDGVNYRDYLNKRAHDAITYYDKAAEDPVLKPTVDYILWHIKCMDDESTRARLARYDVTPPLLCVSSYNLFSHPSAKISFIRDIEPSINSNNSCVIM